MCAERLVPHAKLVPILALRNSVLFPMSVVPVNVGRPRSVRLVEEHIDATGALVGVVTQRTEDTLEPTFEDLYKIGTLARIVKVIRLNSSSYSVVLNGISRFRVNSFETLEPFMQAHVDRLVETGKSDPSLPELTARLRDATRDMLALQPDLPKETASILDTIPGVGPVTRKTLIRRFGSVRGVSAATIEELASAVGEAKARIIKEALGETKQPVDTKKPRE